MIGSTIARLAAAAGARVVLTRWRPSMEATLIWRSRRQLIYGDIRDGSGQRTVGGMRSYLISRPRSLCDSNIDFLDLDELPGASDGAEARRRLCERLIFRFRGSSIEIERNPSMKHEFNCLSIYGVHKLNGEKYYHLSSGAR